MKAIALFVLIMLMVSGASAETVRDRELKRVQAWICDAESMEVPPVVVMTPPTDEMGEFIPIDTEIIADDLVPEVGCTVYDSYVVGGEIKGRMMAWGSPIYEMLLSVSFNIGEMANWIAHWGFMTPVAGTNGAAYDMQSMLYLDENGVPMQYRIGFLRNAPVEIEVKLRNGTRVVIDHPDPLTLISLQKSLLTSEGRSAEMIYILDFRGEQP
jgi:hypothetical protein